MPAGTCITAIQGTPCGAYRCGGTSITCPSSCGGDADCALGFYCIAKACTQARPLGIACTTGSECQSGFCADGVCCDTACTGPCAFCKQPNLVGHCLAFTSGDPRGQCAGSSGCGGACGSDGTCHFPGTEKPCDVCKVCDGTGQCNQLPPSGDDTRCSVLACGVFSTDCTIYDEQQDHRCLSIGLCATPGDPGTCSHSHSLPDGLACIGGSCVGGQCVPIPDGGTTPPKSGGCSFASDARPAAPPLALVALFLVALRRVRRQLDL
jgi:MYXO-CTERM domain-containing protein